MTDPESEQPIRPSDADREAVARLLASAAGEGRMSTTDLSDRLTRVHDAHTYEELGRIVSDLPEAHAPHERTVPEHTRPETLHLTAALRDLHRRGAWRVPPRIRASAGRGSIHLDFTHAIIEHDVVVVDARPNWRNIEIIVPEGYAVTNEEAVPGASDVHDLTTAPRKEGAPEIRIISRPGPGDIIVRHPRPRHRGWPVRGLWPRRKR